MEVRDLQVAEAALMEDLSVAACASEPRRDGGLTITEDPFGGGWVQTFGECSKHHGDLLGGGFQMVQGSIVSSAERGAASLKTKRLDPLDTAMLAVADQGMEVSVSVAKVLTLRVRTSEARGIYVFRGSPPAFHLTPGAHRPWLSSRRGRGGESTGGTIVGSAGLEQTGEPAVLGHAF